MWWSSPSCPTIWYALPSGGFVEATRKQPEQGAIFCTPYICTIGKGSETKRERPKLSHPSYNYCQVLLSCLFQLDFAFPFFLLFFLHRYSQGKGSRVSDHFLYHNVILSLRYTPPYPTIFGSKQQKRPGRLFEANISGPRYMINPPILPPICRRTSNIISPLLRSSVGPTMCHTKKKRIRIAGEEGRNQIIVRKKDDLLTSKVRVEGLPVQLRDASSHVMQDLLPSKLRRELSRIGSLNPRAAFAFA